MSIVSDKLIEIPYIKFGIISEMADTFSEWLSGKIVESGLSQRKVAERGGISPTSISDAISGKSPAGYEVCMGISRGLGIAPEVVLRKAGLLPTVPARTAQHEQLLHLFDQLSEQEKKEVLGYVKFKARGNR